MNDRLTTGEPYPSSVYCFKCHGRMMFAMDIPFANMTPPPPPPPLYQIFDFMLLKIEIHVCIIRSGIGVGYHCIRFSCKQLQQYFPLIHALKKQSGQI